MWTTLPTKLQVTRLEKIYCLGGTSHDELESFMKLAKTRIKLLDDALGGGLPDKSVILMMGEPGSGNDVLARQIMYRHALEEGKVAYFTTFRPPEIVADDFRTFGWDVSHLKADHWTFVDVHKSKALQILQKEVDVRVAKGYWTTIDSLSYILLTQKHSLVLDMMESLLEAARKHGGIHFLLFTQGMHDPQTEMTLQYLADGVIELFAQKTANGTGRLMRIKSMKRTVHSVKPIPFNITKDGIAIETTGRIA